jgi:hypothetical protein
LDKDDCGDEKGVFFCESGDVIFEDDDRGEEIVD